MPDYSFGKKRRLLSARDYQAVFDNTCFTVGDRNLLMLVASNDLDYPRLGLVVARKNVRLAVRRNRIKRVVRETFRQEQPRLGGIDIVFLARKEIDTLSDEALYLLLREKWRGVERKLLANPQVQQGEPLTGGK